MSLEALFTNLVIGVYDKRKFGTFDVPGAYIHSEIPKYRCVIIKLNGYFVDIMCRVNPEHENNVII